MRRKVIKSIGSLACGVMVLVGTATKGMALDFTFSISNQSGNVEGTVTGVIKGLTANETNGQATDIEIYSYPEQLNNGAVIEIPAATIGSPWDIYDDPAYRLVSNSFSTNAAGQVTSASVNILNKNMSLPQLTLFTAVGYQSALETATAPNNAALYTSGPVTFTLVSAAVPWEDRGGESITAIGTILVLGVMRKARQFQKVKVGSSQLEKV